MRGGIEEALRICYFYHRGQLDKAGDPYYLHPITVALRLEGEEERITALLHDTIEDTELELEDLRRFGFSENVIEAVRLLTRNGGDYLEYISRLKGNSLARAVKIEDLRHNLDLSRLAEITERDLRRAAKYRKALEILTE